jgi:hypothetical protein
MRYTVYAPSEAPGAIYYVYDRMGDRYVRMAGRMPAIRKSNRLNLARAKAKGLR